MNFNEAYDFAMKTNKIFRENASSHIFSELRNSIIKENGIVFDSDIDRVLFLLSLRVAGVNYYLGIMSEVIEIHQKEILKLRDEIKQLKSKQQPVAVSLPAIPETVSQNIEAVLRKNLKTVTV
jgi:hypothetical protein